ncbi:GspE/PulE family protein [Aliarcobacter butzleri]|uniref:GspE/PulE family protein n=1 Tax=Aliarcobacter butzleri TaxID=28197 RepID=UPI0021B48F4F|nr:GspE/PulE family protein [Aliarcobacter butzleri]MCT7610226.1 GspE/PulE family protein [Aliarcobacter butzleri]
MNINEIHNTNLVAFDEVENYLIALKNYVLYTKINENVVIALSKEYMSISFDYLSKIKADEEIIFLDELSFEKLYNKFLELKTDKEMSAIQQEQEDATLNDDDFSVSDFLKVGNDILTSEESAPIIKFVNSLFYQAIKKDSSDIHIEMHEFKAEVKYRIDGVLVKHIELDKNIMSLVISRIKVISNLDISEKRIPQDGRTQIKIAGKTLDIRVSILPTFYGERVVMRILMQSEDIKSIKELGFPKFITDEIENILQNSYGMILVTGPTGSGKSTTLHSLLHQVVSEEKNIITVEDPVEYKSNEFSQIQVNTKVGLTFASGLRSILRQDPDIIMVGEIRDKETASIAVQSALTGHLLFSTLHTNRAPAAITRLIDMGVEKFLISSSLLAVLAQRLVRKLCDDCKCIDNSEYSYELFNINKNKTIYKAKGCKNCNFTGYKGRTAIGEFFVINDEIREFLKGEIDDNTLMKLAIKNGMISLDKQLRILLENGNTSIDEVIRIGIKE